MCETEQYQLHLRLGLLQFWRHGSRRCFAASIEEAETVPRAYQQHPYTARAIGDGPETG